jgi:hypothetical protein
LERALGVVVEEKQEDWEREVKNTDWRDFV